MFLWKDKNMLIPLLPGAMLLYSGYYREGPRHTDTRTLSCRCVAAQWNKGRPWKILEILVMYCNIELIYKNIENPKQLAHKSR